MPTKKPALWLYLLTISAGLAVWATPPDALAKKVVLQQKSPASVEALVQLEVHGELKTPYLDKEGKRQLRSLPLVVKGSLEYSERTLEGADGNRRAMRAYQKPKVEVSVDGRRFQPTLAADRLILVEVADAEVTFRSPQGLLSQEELDLVDVQGNNLLLHRLLPSQAVGIGDSWDVPASDAAPLLGLDVAHQGQLQARLKDIKDGKAQILFQGSIEGAAHSVPSHVDWEADAEFDLQRKMFTWFDIAFNESRQPSGAEPGIEAKSHLRITLRPTALPRQLSDQALAAFPMPKETAELLKFQSSGGFSLVHSPRWRFVSASPKRTVVRLLDAGDVIAQGNLAKLPDFPAGQQLTLEAFQEDVRQTLTAYEGQLAQAEQTNLDNGLRLLRITALGKVKAADVQWVYLHASDNAGNRVSCVFTLEQKMVERFQGADLELLSGLTFE